MEKFPTLDEWAKRFLKPITPKEHKIAMQLEKEYWRHRKVVEKLNNRLLNAEKF